MVDAALFSSATDEWYTPQDLFTELNRKYSFELDVAASAENAKCESYYTKEEDGLKQPWIGRVWCNPPYGRQVGDWVQKAHDEFLKDNANYIMMLLPARTDTKWFHKYIYRMPLVSVDFIKGRLKFGGAVNSAPFPSMLVTWERL